MAYRLDLPPNLRIHPVFHVSLLRGYQEPNTIEHQTLGNPPPPAITIDDHQEYEVEQIMDQCIRYRRKEFLVKWVGHPEHDATWEPEINLQNAQTSIQEFIASRMLLEGRGSNVMVLQDDGSDKAQYVAQCGTAGIVEHSTACEVECGTACEVECSTVITHDEITNYN